MRLHEQDHDSDNSGCDSNHNNNNNGNSDNNDTNYQTVNRILELKEDEPSKVVGTIIVESLNGNNEDSYCNDEEAGDDRQLHPDVVCRSCDQLFLEDESGRVALRFARDESDTKKKKKKKNFAYEYCTGVVVGVQGYVDALGVMHVKRIVAPALPPPFTAAAAAADATDHCQDKNEQTTTAPHLLLVSSLHCGDPGVSSLPRELLVSYLQGHFGPKASKVAMVVVAGSGPGTLDPTMGLREFDLFGLQITRTAGLPLDVLPSAKDPTTRNWPQRPLHSSLLPHTLRAVNNSADNNNNGNNNNNKQPMTNMTPNPYQAQIGDRLVLGTDGLNVRDLQKYILKPPSSDSDNDNDNMPQRLTELEALEQTLRWAHLCPTGPNSPDIGMVPLGDPMAMNSKQSPNIYFCGNSNEGFATKLLKHKNTTTTAASSSSSSSSSSEGKTRLVCVPKFSETGEAVLVNLNTLAVEVLRFAANEIESETKSN